MAAPPYPEPDLHRACRPGGGGGLSLADRNLLHQRRPGTASDLAPMRHYVYPSVYGKASWAF